MAPEKFYKIPGHSQIEDAKKINEVVNDKLKRTKTKGADEIAHEVIKDQMSRRIDIRKLIPEEQLWYENLQDAGVNVFNDGFLEITRWDNTGKNFKKPLLIKQKVDGVNSAIRMQDHILDNYRSKEGDNELEQLESIQEVIENCNQLLNRWSKATPEEKKDLQLQLTEVVMQLENCRNEFKTAVRDQAEAVAELRDSQNRENPGAFAARTVSALHNVLKRINELQLIMPAMAFRKELLVFEKRKIHDTTNRAASRLNGILHHAVFHRSPKRPETRINDNEVEELNLQLGRVLNLLGRIHVLPYSQKAEQAGYVIKNLKKYFATKKKLIENLDPVRNEIGDALNILKSDIEDLG